MRAVRKGDTAAVAATESGAGSLPLIERSPDESAEPTADDDRAPKSPPPVRMALILHSHRRRRTSVHIHIMFICIHLHTRAPGVINWCL
jgi:hypothetical protein